MSVLVELPLPLAVWLEEEVAGLRDVLRQRIERGRPLTKEALTTQMDELANFTILQGLLASAIAVTTGEPPSAVVLQLPVRRRMPPSSPGDDAA